MVDQAVGSFTKSRYFLAVHREHVEGCLLLGDDLPSENVIRADFPLDRRV